MLLLTAIILAIGFIALASMAARIDQIPGQAETIQEDLFFTEVSIVADGVAEAMDSLARDSAVPLGNDTFTAELEGALAHLEYVERGRGFHVKTSTPTCSGSAILEVDISIASTVHQVTLTVSREYPLLTC